MFVTAAEALAALEPGHDEWRRAEGTFRFARGGEEPGFVDVLGHIEDVLAARVTAEGLGSRAFSAKEFSLGLGGLGASTEEVEQGEFVDMRHLLDRTAITRAWIGMNDVRDFPREGGESAG